MMDMIKTKLRIGLALVLCLGLVACSQSQIILDLDVAAAAVAAVSVVPGIPAPIAAYIAVTATALDCVVAAVEKGGTNAQVALAITACGLTGAAPNLPPGTPQTIVAVVQAVVTAVQKVLADTTTITAQLQGNPIENGGGAGALSFLGGDKGSQKFKLGKGGMNKVKKIRKTLQDAKNKVTQGMKADAAKK